MKKAIALTLAIIFCATLLVGCSGSGGGTTLSGKYEATSIEMDGQNLLESLAAMGITGDKIYIEFLDGEKFSLVMDAMGAENQEGTYKVAGNTITLTIDGEGAPATLDGNKITLEQDGAKLVFEKK